MRVTSVTPMKNEGPYILEWVAHNRMIGINDMMVFSNHCSDHSDEILDRLDELGLLRHAPNPSVRMTNPRHHKELVGYVNDMARLRRSDWVTHLDADEFFRIKVGAGRIEDLVNALPDAHAISLSLHTFGCGGVEDVGSADTLVTETFLRRADSANRRNPVKYLARGDFPWVGFHNNAPEVAARDLDRVNWFNGDGKRLPREKIATPFKALPAALSGFGLVDVAHYTIRSFHGYLLQRDRGNANPIRGVEPEHLDLNNAMRYWDRFNKNEIRDDTSRKHNPDLRAAVDDLLKDPELHDLHDAACAWHKNRVGELLTSRPYAQLLSRIKASHAQSAA